MFSFVLLAGSRSASASPAFAQQDDPYHMTKRGIKKGWHKTKNISKKVWYKGKWVAVKSWKKGNQVGQKVWYKGKWVTYKTARGTKRVFVKTKNRIG